MICLAGSVCIVRIQPWKHVLDRADRTVLTGQHDLGPADRIDQGLSALETSIMNGDLICRGMCVVFQLLIFA